MTLPLRSRFVRCTSTHWYRQQSRSTHTSSNSRRRLPHHPFWDYGFCSGCWIQFSVGVYMLPEQRGGSKRRVQASWPSMWKLWLSDRPLKQLKGIKTRRTLRTAAVALATVIEL